MDENDQVPPNAPVQDAPPQLLDKPCKIVGITVSNNQLAEDFVDPRVELLGEQPNFSTLRVKLQELGYTITDPTYFPHNTPNYYHFDMFVDTRVKGHILVSTRPEDMDDLPPEDPVAEQVND